MSRLVVRILLSIFVIPLGAVIYMVWIFGISTAWFLSSRSQEIESLCTAGLITWVCVAVYWLLIWRKSTHWTKLRKTKLIVAALAAALVAFIISCLLAARGGSDFSTFIGSILAPILWLISSIFIMRETPAERTERLRLGGRNNIACPLCGYNLTGLTESRCPECGSKFTLDELLTAQQSPLAGDVE